MVLAARFTEDKYQASDILFSLVLVDLVLAAYFADEQQWSEWTPECYFWPLVHCWTFASLEYQSAKKVYQKNAKVPSDFHQEELDCGFNTTGLWSLSRHPNFAAEQGFWVVLYTWSCWTTETYYNWSVVGAVSYLILFQASTWFTELITAKKYPDYREYQQRVGKFLPNITSGLPGNFSDKRVSKSK